MTPQRLRLPMPSPSAEPLTWSDLPHAPAPGTALVMLNDLVEGQAQMVSVTQAPGAADSATDFKVLVLRNGTQVHAFANRCPHFGVPLAARQSQLIQTPYVSVSCNVHYSRFRWSDGVCETGECVGEALLSVPVVVDAQGQVCIATAPSAAKG
ncbi:Rieske (2Fe-2S) protein [Rhodoferax aquaticus]|uniref:Rieske domain-containing protein n=1 Tax=Rhodoferax aquaticus TaxID=2527691 RepID=A0A515ET24_9BURK|nr:Rieske 2Fe-2S domain-containing protein [Rhodoferax aquaticus]QDL55713.1 hypothetical protein EXZ61_16905 [Rhodoferax aquaticus]